LRKLTFILFCKPPVFPFHCFILSQPTSTITVFVVRITSRFAFTIYQNASFCYEKVKKFSGEGHSPSPDPSPRGGVSPSPHPTPRRLRRLDSRAFGARFGHGRPKAWARGSCPLENQKTMKCRHKLRALRLAPSTLPLEKFLRADNLRK
jgi:hypothetical protein